MPRQTGSQQYYTTKIAKFLHKFAKFFRYLGSPLHAFIFSEVIDLGGEPIKNTDYTYLGRVTEFKYGQKLSEVVK